MGRRRRRHQGHRRCLLLRRRRLARRPSSSPPRPLRDAAVRWFGLDRIGLDEWMVVSRFVAGVWWKGESIDHKTRSAMWPAALGRVIACVRCPPSPGRCLCLASACSSSSTAQRINPVPSGVGAGGAAAAGGVRSIVGTVPPLSSSQDAPTFVVVSHPLFPSNPPHTDRQGGALSWSSRWESGRVGVLQIGRSLRDWGSKKTSEKVSGSDKAEKGVYWVRLIKSSSTQHQFSSPVCDHDCPLI